MKSTIWLFGSPRFPNARVKRLRFFQRNLATLGFEREWGMCWWTSFHNVSRSYYLSFNDQETGGSTNKSTLFQQNPSVRAQNWGAHVSKLPKVGALWSGPREIAFNESNMPQKSCGNAPVSEGHLSHWTAFYTSKRWVFTLSSAGFPVFLGCSTKDDHTTSMRIGSSVGTSWMVFGWLMMSLWRGQSRPGRGGSLEIWHLFFSYAGNIDSCLLKPPRFVLNLRDEM